MIRIIANPAAGRGRARRLFPAAHAAFASLGAVTWRETEGPGDEARLVHEALDAGSRTIVALGGDGTWSKVASAMVAARTDCTLALLAGGTGNDLAWNLGIPATDPRAVARLVETGATRQIDVGYIDDRCFVNAAGFGFDAAVLEAAAGRTWPSGDALYLACAIERLFGYGGIDVAVGDVAMQRHLLLVIANGSRFGGGFRIAPSADPSDGVLDVVGITDATAARRVHLLAAATRGAHVGMRGVSVTRVSELSLRFPEAPIYEADGDLCRAAAPQVVVRCVPDALRVITSASFAAPARPSESVR
jgi:diacylglycerol kinase (ATP)